MFLLKDKELLKREPQGSLFLCSSAIPDWPCDRSQSYLPDKDLLQNLYGLRMLLRRNLPSLLSALSEQYHLPFKRVKITGSKGRWGSCSGTGSINLSCYLMLLPPHLMDYVLLHELSHTKEMNHGPRFWELLDSMTGGRARALRAELRRFNTDF